MARYPKSFQRVAVSAYLHTSAIQAEKNQKFADAMADADLRICVFCDRLTYAYLCTECNDYKGLTKLADAEKFYSEIGKSLFVIVTR